MLMFRLNIIDHDKDGGKANESFTQELKMDMLRKEELRLADEGANADQPSGVGKSWMSRSMNSFLGSIIAKIASNFTLTATKYVFALSLVLMWWSIALT